jgi:hypothetical protein
MPQPTPYFRGYSFTDYQATNPSVPLPAAHVDAELDGVSATLQGVLGNLELIQRDDGKLREGCVTVDSLSPELFDALQGVDGTDGTDGISPPPPNFTIAAHTVAPGGAATVNVTGAYPNLNLDFGLPRGDPAAPGEATLPDGDYGDVRLSAGGTHMKVETVLDGQVPATATDLTGKLNLSGDAGDFTTPGAGSTGAIRVRAQGDDSVAFVQVTNHAASVQWGVWAYDPDGSADWQGAGLKNNGQAIYHAGNKPTKADVGLGNVDNTADADKPISTATAAALGGKASTGSVAAKADAAAVAAALALKADAITPIASFNVDQPVNDGSHNGQYNRMTGATTRTVTFGNTPAAGHASIWVNRGTVNMTIACPGGYYKNGAAATSAVNLNLAPGGKLTAFHEGAGVWTFEGTGF